MAVPVLRRPVPRVPQTSRRDAVGNAPLSIADALERTAGRTIFTCHHPAASRRQHETCEICWDCRSVRGINFDQHWPPATRIQLPDRTMTTLSGRVVADDWKVSPVSYASHLDPNVTRTSSAHDSDVNVTDAREADE